MALLEASGIGKNFGDTKVLKDISLTLEQGEALATLEIIKKRKYHSCICIFRNTFSSSSFFKSSVNHESFMARNLKNVDFPAP